VRFHAGADYGRSEWVVQPTGHQDAENSAVALNAPTVNTKIRRIEEPKIEGSRCRAGATPASSRRPSEALILKYKHD
jgi:hypothetical protein